MSLEDFVVERETAAQLGRSITSFKRVGEATPLPDTGSGPAVSVPPILYYQDGSAGTVSFEVRREDEAWRLHIPGG